jgi:sterol desaturase/sphingolipid hydroxylase (fatty acid hydroxylase superfamily)
MNLISLDSFINFIFINTIFFSYSYIEYYIYNLYHIDFDLITLFFILFFRNIFLLLFLEINTQKYTYIDNNNYNKKINIKEFCFYFLQTSFLESFSLYILLNTNVFNKNISLTNDLLLFIPKSFLFEIIFDLLHYTTHKLEHQNQFLYKHFHKIHHIHNNPTFITTYYHHFGDLILTNILPFHISIFICQNLLNYNMSIYFIFLLSFIKIYIELCGHSGKNITKIGSFVQFIWITRLFNIELFTIDHNNHHIYNNCNYSKRFSLWDKVFETYRY